MEENNIMTNENTEVCYVSEDAETNESGNATKIAVGLGLATLVGGVIYKFAVKPVIAKLKAKKEQEREAQEYAEKLRSLNVYDDVDEDQDVEDNDQMKESE